MDRPPPAQKQLALLVAGAFFMEILDGTVIAPAAPRIAGDLGVAPVAVNVAITAYVLTLAVLIPISGWLADRFGARRVFGAAITIFTIASAGCALAQSLPMLTSTRVLQGVGGAMMVPVGRLVVLRTTAKPDLVKAIAYLTWPALVAPVIAPAVGGILATYASWRWIFVINIPLGVVGLLLSRRLVPDVRSAQPARLDRRGFALTALGIAGLVVGMESVGATDPDWPVVAVGFGVAATMLPVAVAHLRRTSMPLLNLAILRVATLRIAATAGSMFRSVISAVPFLLPLFFELGFGWNAAQAGLVVITLFVGNIAVKPATTPLMRRFGIRSVMVSAVVASAVCLIGIAFLTPSTPLVAVIVLLVASGVCRSVGLTTYNSVAFADVQPEWMSNANTLFSTLQELGTGIGVAVGALLVRLGEPVADAVGLGARPDQPFRVAFVLLAVLLVVPAAAALRLTRTAGNTVTGRA